MELDAGDKELLRRAMMRIQSANDTLNFLSDHFRDKYGLTPENQITPDGQIIYQKSMVVPDGIGTLQGITRDTN